MKMTYMVKSVLVALAAFFAAIVQAQPTQDAFLNQAAYDVVESATSQLISQVTGKRDLYTADNELFYADVDDLLSSIIDFKRIARRVMGKHYKKAAPAQREAFEHVFKRSLLKVYAKALLDYNNERIVILPPTGKKTVNPKRQRVDIDFFSAAGKKFPISYSMYLNKEKQWKMENVVVSGVNIGLTYRNQFARLMSENKNDVGLAVASWTLGFEAGQ
jgi:phospholipid transport system substrate-binding protein